MRVGVFDSGLGGLTVVSSIVKSLEGLEIFYIADTLFAPYGEKSQKQILDRSLDITDYLIKNHKIDVLIVACNTATSAAIKTLRQNYSNLIIIGTEPAIKPAMKQSKSKSIAVLATFATLKGQKYKELLDRLSNEYKVEVHEKACVGLVEQIEDGKIEHKQTFSMLENWLNPMKEKEVDTIVLGCTHYPLVSELIKQIMGENTTLIETGSAIAKRLKELSCNKKYEKKDMKIDVFYTSKIKKDMIDKILENWIDGGKIEVRNTDDR